MKRATWVSITVAAILLSGLLGTANLFLGSLNQDEGWYLYAAKQITQGNLLYRDFMFTQGPALPYFYGALFPVIEKWGVAGGRLITTLLGLTSVGCAAWLAARAVPSKGWKPAALCAFILAGVNVYQSYFTVIVKTYALCAFFLTAGFAALSYTSGRRSTWAAFFGGVLLALASCTRLSAGIVLPVACLWLIWNREKVNGHRSGVREIPAWMAFGLGASLILVFGIGTFFLLSPGNTEFALFGYHAGRSPGGLMQIIALKAGFVSRFVQAYFVFFAGLLLVFALQRLRWPIREVGFEEMTLDSRPNLIELLREANAKRSPFARSFISLLWLCGALVTLVHLLAPFPYDDYQVIIYPLLSAALAVTLLPHCPERHQLRAAFALLLICAAASFSSPLNQEWLIRKRDRVWWKFKEIPDLLALQKIGTQLRNQLGANPLLLTQDTYLAIEAGACVPHGMEMGPFSYYPDMPREQAEKRHVLNQEMLIEELNLARAPIAAFSGYGLAIRSPELKELSSSQSQTLRDAIEANYQKTTEIQNFGQAHTRLEIFTRQP